MCLRICLVINFLIIFSEFSCRIARNEDNIIKWRTYSGNQLKYASSKEKSVHRGHLQVLLSSLISDQYRSASNPSNTLKKLTTNSPKTSALNILKRSVDIVQYTNKINSKSQENCTINQYNVNDFAKVAIKTSNQIKFNSSVKLDEDILKPNISIATVKPLSDFEEDIKILNIPVTLNDVSPNDTYYTNGTSVNDQDTLVLVTVIFRHGDRTIYDTEKYPKDPYFNIDYFPIGSGQLTMIGKRRSYKLGQELRKRYGKFLGDTYYSRIVNAQSSNTNRNKIALDLVLAGLFPPKKEEIIDESIRGWQPIAYTYWPVGQDKLLSPALCKNYKTESDKLLLKPEIQKFLRRCQNTFDYVSRNSGLNITSIFDMYALNLGLRAEEELGLKLPEWTKSVYPKIFNEMAIRQYYMDTASYELRAIFAGELLKKIIHHFDHKLSSPNEKFARKIHVYSAHDTNIAPVLISLGVFDNQIPNYGAYIIFELHVINSIPGIKFFYDNWYDQGLKLIKLPGCATFCPLEKFIRLISKILPQKGVNDCVLLHA